MSYICSNCGYKTETVRGKKCPYCDKNSLEQEKTAEELVNEIGFE